MILGPIYSRTSKGQIQVWSVEVDGYRYRTIEGIKDGKMTTSKWTVAEAKNVGRTNATSPETQAVLEAKAKLKKKLEADYHEKEEDVDIVRFFQPTLAEEWSKHQMQFPFLVSPKMDGMRCVIMETGAFTRNGKPIPAAAVFREHLQPAFDKNPGLVFDGELYGHLLKSDFNKLISLVKKQKLTDDDRLAVLVSIQFHAFDLAGAGLSALPYDLPGQGGESRHSKLVEYANLCNLGKVPLVEVVPQIWVENEEQLKHHVSKFVELGYEGTMCKNYRVAYENKRTKNLLKIKDFIDEEFVVVDVNEGEGNRSGMMGELVLANHHTGGTFTSNALGNEEFYIRVLAEREKLKGKKATVRYQNLTPDKEPRFPRVIEIRDYE